MTKKASITLIFDFSYSLNQFSFFDIGQTKEFIDIQKSESSFLLAYKQHLSQELEAVIHLTTKLKAPLSIYLSGTFLRLLQKTDMNMIEQLRYASGEHLELLTGCYCNSLSPVFSLKNALTEINMHNDYLESIFSTRANKSYLFENMYANNIIEQLSTIGITSSFAGAIDWYLDGEQNMKILKSKPFTNYTVLLPDNDSGASIFNNPKQKNHFIQLDTSSASRLGNIQSIVKRLEQKTIVCSIDEQLSDSETEKTYNIKSPIMLGHQGVTLDTIRSNALQNSAIKHYYLLNKKLNKSSDQKLVDAYLLLGHSDHFIKMGLDYEDVAYDVYANYMNILNDLELRLSVQI